MADKAKHPIDGMDTECPSLRYKARYVVDSKAFEYFILVCIIGNSISLAINTAALGSTARTALDVFDYVVLAIFTLEMLLKWVAYGLWLTEGAYFRNGWNVLDALVVLLGFLSLSELGNLSALRALRVVRFLRVTKAGPIKDQVEALLSALPMATEVLVLWLFAVIVFAIIGLHALSGATKYRCSTPDFSKSLNTTSPDNPNLLLLGQPTWQVPTSETTAFCSGPKILSSLWTAPSTNSTNITFAGTLERLSGQGRQCQSGMFCVPYTPASKDYTTFDNMLWSMLSVFVVTTLKGWPPVLIKYQQAVSYYVNMYIYAIMLAVPIVGGALLVTVLAAAVNKQLSASKQHKQKQKPSEDNAPDTNLDEDGSGSNEGRTVVSPACDSLFGKSVHTRCNWVQSQQWFHWLSMAVVLANTALLATYHAGMSEAHQNAIAYSNYAFVAFFTLEMAVKLVGLGPRKYCQDGMNVLDALVTVCGILEVLINLGSANDGPSVAAVFRALRALRLLQLARWWPTMQWLVTTTGQTLVDCGAFLVLLVLVLLAFAIMGVQLFAFKFQTCDVPGASLVCPLGMSCGPVPDCWVKCNATQANTWMNVTKSPYGKGVAYCQQFTDPANTTNTQFMAQVGHAVTPNRNFDNIGWAFLTTWNTMARDGFWLTLADAGRTTGDASVLYFVAVIVVAHFILLPLLMALMFANFSKGMPLATKAATGAQPQAAGKNSPHDSLPVDTLATSDQLPTPALQQSPSRATVPIAPAADPAPVSLQGNSLGFLGPDSTLRNTCANIINNPYFQRAILLLVLLSIVCLALSEPWLDHSSDKKRVLLVLDYIVVAAFAVEAALKIVTLGFAMNGEHSYIRDPWNAIDLLVVVVGALQLALDAASVTTSAGRDASTYMGMLRVLRVLRVLRILKAAHQFQGTAIVIRTFLKMLPVLGTLIVLAACMVFIFAIGATTLFAGRLGYCTTTPGASLPPALDPYYYLPPGQPMTKEWCLSKPTVFTSAYHAALNLTLPEPLKLTSATWFNPTFNYDNVLNSFVSVWLYSPLYAWYMYAGIDTTSPGMFQQPVARSHPEYGAFFIAAHFGLGFFLLRLFQVLGVVELKKMLASNSTHVILTAAQERWVDAQRMMVIMRAVPQHRRPASWLRALVFDITESKAFNICVHLVILLNTASLSMAYVGMSGSYSSTLWAINIVANAVYGVELLLRLAALGPRTFAKEDWNLFSLVLVLLSVAGMIAQVVTGNMAYAGLSAPRALMLLRVLVELPFLPGIKELLNTLVYSIPGLINVGVTLVLLLVMFAIVCMNMFSGVRYNTNLNPSFNFDSFGTTLQYLLRSSVGAQWEAVLYDLVTWRDCIQITKAQPGLNITRGSYLDPSSPLLTQIPASEQLDQCNPYPWLTVIVMSACVLIWGWLTMSLFVGVLMDNFKKALTDDKVRGQVQSGIKAFRDTWLQFDPDASEYIPVADLPQLLLRTPAPLGCACVGHQAPDAAASAVEVLQAAPAIPVYKGDKVHYVAVLYALVYRHAAAILPDKTEEMVRAMLQQQLPDERKATGQSADTWLAQHAQKAEHDV